MSNTELKEKMNKLRRMFFKRFTYIPDHIMAGPKWKEDDGRAYSPSPFEAWEWIEKLVQSEVEAAEKREIDTRRTVINAAVRRAHNLFDKWNEVTGYFVKHTSYYIEMQSLLEDAVHCGVQEVAGVYVPLDSEGDDEVSEQAN
jgi:hypothetical protein